MERIGGAGADQRVNPRLQVREACLRGLEIRFGDVSNNLVCVRFAPSMTSSPRRRTSRTCRRGFTRWIFSHFASFINFDHTRRFCRGIYGSFIGPI